MILINKRQLLGKRLVQHIHFKQNILLTSIPCVLVLFLGQLIHKTANQWRDSILLFAVRLTRSAINNSTCLNIKYDLTTTWPCLTAKYRLCISETCISLSDTSAAILKNN